ncbi:MAG: ABC transporter permease [Xanthomonadales bacterium]|jgi:lipopolysaccharide transport system permease protein|nr:ABC transporter permease [Xanthomonadales bacterium]
MAMNFSFFNQQLQREISGKHRGSSPLWILLQPLLLLAVYSFVFTQIFQARVPAGLDSGFVIYLALGYWPWSAFSESVLRNLSVINEHAALIRKVAIRRDTLVLARVCGVFILHGLGFLAVLLVLSIAGQSVLWQFLPVAIVLLLLLALLAVGFSLLFSAVQVIVPSISHMVQPAMLLMFFSTPILWAPSMLPEQYQSVVQLNPMAWWVGAMRELMLAGSWHWHLGGIIFLVALFMVPLLGYWVFHRLSPHFEDYL